MIPELGHRVTPNPAPTTRARLEAPDPRLARTRDAARGPDRPDADFGPADEASDPGADFALSLSSASLRLSEERSTPAPLDARTAVDASPAATPPETAPRGPASRAIEAYREIARAPVGEHVRILV